MRMTTPVCIALLFAGTVHAAPPAEEGVARSVTAFYETCVRLQLAGVPDAGQRAQLRPLVSPALDAALAAADEAETRYAKKTNRQVPPLVQGDLFTSLFEGASRVTVASCSGDAGRASCPVDFVYQDSKSGPETRWQDRVHVVKAATGWVVDDVEYAGSWSFARRGRLTDTLKAVVREADR